MARTKGEFTAEALRKRQEAMKSPLLPKIMKYGAKAQVAIFRATNGRVGSNWRIGAGFRKPVPTLLLNHVGRTSGAAYTTPLLYLDDGADLVIVGSQGGAPKHPQWYRNLIAHPDTSVELKGEGKRSVHAREATESERATLWPRLDALYADFADYRAVAGDRVIPIIVLEPR